MLQRGGWQVYSGPLGSKFVRYLEDLPGVRRLSPDENPAAWMLDVLSAGRPATDTVEPVTIERNARGAKAMAYTQSFLSQKGIPARWQSDAVRDDSSPFKGDWLQAAFFASSFWKGEHAAALLQACSPAMELGAKDFTVDQATGPSALVQIAALVSREFAASRRNVPYHYARILSVIFVNLIVSLLCIWSILPLTKKTLLMYLCSLARYTIVLLKKQQIWPVCSV